MNPPISGIQLQSTTLDVCASTKLLTKGRYHFADYRVAHIYWLCW